MRPTAQISAPPPSDRDVIDYTYGMATDLRTLTLERRLYMLAYLLTMVQMEAMDLSTGRHSMRGSG